MKKAGLILFLILSIFIAHFFVSDFLPINSVAQAETGEVEINLADYLKLKDGQKVSEVFAKPSDMVNLLVRVVFVLVGLILFAMVVISGLSMIASGTSEGKDKAKGTLTTALIGFLIIFGAYWIMQIIQILTGTNIGF